MNCLECGAANHADAAFCRECRRTIPESARAAARMGVPLESGGWATPYYDRELAISVPVYAGFWQRFLAWIIDLIVSAIAGVVIGLALAIVVLVIVSGTQPNAVDRFEEDRQSDEQSDAFEIGFYLGYYVTSFGYFWIGTALGGPIGKRALGLRVVRARDGRAPGFGSAFIRVIVSWISGIPLYLGYFWSIWDDRKQTWHDKAARTVVIER